MRKLRIYLCTLLAVVYILQMNVCVMQVRAEESTIYHAEELHVNPLYADVISEEDLADANPVMLLSDDQEYLTSTQEAGKVIREGMKQRQESIVVYFVAEEYSSTLIHAIADQALVHTGNPTEGDYLKWQFGGWKTTTTYITKNDMKYMNITYTYTYYTTAGQEAEMDAAVEKLLTDLNIADQNDYTKIRRIYDYICSHVRYDHEHDEDYKLKYTAYAALTDEMAVCQGYAALFYRLMLELGVDSRLISGTGNNELHGWNIVELKDSYYNLDATWDAGADTYRCFLKSEADFEGHVRHDEYATESFDAEYPMDAESYTVQLSANPDACDHDYGTGTIPGATCTEGGSIIYTCSSCSDSYTGIVSPMEHSFSDYISDENATCTKDGTKTAVCTRCGLKNTVTDEGSSAKIDHQYESIVTEPSCTEDGYTIHTCIVCGDTWTSDTVSATGHTEMVTVGEEATCVENGLTDGSVCSVCGVVIREQEVIPAVGHVYVNGICTGCGEKESDVLRICGDTRYETAVGIANTVKSTMKIDTFDTIIVASGKDFPDALAGSYLSSVKEAPILLVNETSIEKVKDYVAENLSENGTVYILGGTDAVSGSMEETLVTTGIRVKRLQGDNRYGTNLEILKEAEVPADQEILICSAWDYPDAISASATGKPILLVGELLTEEQVEFLKKTSGKFVIVGGTAIIRTETEAALRALGEVERVHGATRYETSVAVAERFFENPDATVVAYGRNFPDGLCGGLLACVQGAPMLLVGENQEAAEAYCAENQITQGTALGGMDVLMDDSLRAIFALEEDEAIIEIRATL